VRTAHPRACRSNGEVIRDRTTTNGEGFREQAADVANLHRLDIDQSHLSHMTGLPPLTMGVPSLRMAGTLVLPVRRTETVSPTMQWQPVTTATG
jgi:hypothetical protein